MAARLCIIASAVVFSTVLLVSRSGLAARTPQPTARATLVYTVASEYEPSAWLSGGERFPNGATVFVGDAAGHRPLVPGFAATADAAVSFDGREIAFAGKQHAGDRWQIWAVGLAGGQARRISQCTDDCVRPLYLQPDAIVYARKLEGRFVIETAPPVAADRQTLQLTYGLGNSLPTDVLLDGRVLFETAVQRVGDAASEVYAVYSDGSGVESYRCDHGRSRQSGRQLPGGDVVFARDEGLARFTSPLAHDVPVAAPAGTYAGDVATFQDGTWLVTWRGAGRDRFELRRWKPGTPTLQPYLVRPNAHVIEPVFVRPHPVPNRHPSGLHDWSYANMLCLNAYTSKHRFAPGSIASARVYTREADGSSRLLGTAPVEKDGSFFARVPGDRPLRIELIDTARSTLHAEAGWFWMRRGEQRICVGCHAGPETAPENAVPAILLRSTVPADLTGNKGTPTGGH